MSALRSAVRVTVISRSAAHHGRRLRGAAQPAQHGTSGARPVGSQAYNQWRARHLEIAPRMPLAPGGVFPAVAGDAVRSYRTVSTLPPTRRALLFAGLRAQP